MSKLKRQVIRALNIKAGDTQGQIELVYDPYKNNLENILNSTLDNTVAGIINVILYTLK